MKIVHKVIYNCEEATKYVVQKGDIKLSMIQRMRLWMHMQMCDACRRFDIQNEWIDKQMKNLLPNEEGHLSHEQKEKMDQTLQNEIKK